jgi:hypothetical protein
MRSPRDNRTCRRRRTGRSRRSSRRRDLPDAPRRPGRASSRRPARMHIRSAGRRPSCRSPTSASSTRPGWSTSVRTRSGSNRRRTRRTCRPRPYSTGNLPRNHTHTRRRTTRSRRNTSRSSGRGSAPRPTSPFRRPTSPPTTGTEPIWTAWTILLKGSVSSGNAGLCTATGARAPTTSSPNQERLNAQRAESFPPCAEEDAQRRRRPVRNLASRCDRGPVVGKLVDHPCRNRDRLQQRQLPRACSAHRGRNGPLRQALRTTRTPLLATRGSGGLPGEAAGRVRFRSAAGRCGARFAGAAAPPALQRRHNRRHKEDRADPGGTCGEGKGTQHGSAYSWRPEMDGKFPHCAQVWPFPGEGQGEFFRDSRRLGLREPTPSSTPSYGSKWTSTPATDGIRS